MGTTVSVIVRVRNSTKEDITSLSAYDIDNFDFGARLRPDTVFKAVSVPAGRCVEGTIELNSIATNCPFAMRMAFADGSVDVLKINAKCAYDDTEPDLRHTKKSHCLYYKRTGPRIIELVVENTAEQVENRLAMELNKQGCQLLELGKYEEASIRLLEASQKASKEETVAAIRRNKERLDSVKGNDIDKMAVAVNEEGLGLFRENKFQQAVKKFEEALKIAKNPERIGEIAANLERAQHAKANQEAKMLNQEGLLLTKTDQWERAGMKFDEALRVALDPVQRASLKTNKADTLCQEGMEELENAWLTEISLLDNNDNAIHKFARAKFLFEQANSVKPDPEYKKLVELVDVKIEGNRHFSMALELENEGSHFIDEAIQSELLCECKTAKKKFQAALGHYTLAKEKFEEGVRRGNNKFKLNVELTEEALKSIEKILSELEKTERDMEEQ